MPVGLRWTMWMVAQLFRVGRLIGALLMLGGLVSTIAGLVTVDWRLAVGGVIQVAFFAVLLGLGGGRHRVVEVKGPTGDCVIRVGRQRLWRSDTGGRRILSLVRGDFVWAATVRRREADPFGTVLYRQTALTERGAIAAAERLGEDVRGGVNPDRPEP